MRTGFFPRSTWEFAGGNSGPPVMEVLIIFGPELPCLAESAPCILLFDQFVTTSDAREIVKFDRSNDPDFGSLASVMNSGTFSYFVDGFFANSGVGHQDPEPAILGPIASVTVTINQVCFAEPFTGRRCGNLSGYLPITPRLAYVDGTVTVQTTPEPSSGVFALMGVGVICHMRRRNKRRRHPCQLLAQPASGKSPRDTNLLRN